MALPEGEGLIRSLRGFVHTKKVFTFTWIDCHVKMMRLMPEDIHQQVVAHLLAIINPTRLPMPMGSGEGAPADSSVTR